MNKMTKKSLIFSLLGFALPAMAMVAPENPYAYENFKQRFSEEEFLAKHSVPLELKVILDKNFPQDIDPKTYSDFRPTEFSWLPGYFVKQEAERIIGSHLIRQCAQENNCNLISAPVKYFYKSGPYLYAISQAIKISNTPFSLAQVKQIYKILKLTHYNDINPHNIANSSDEKAYFIDTENISFTGYCPYSGKFAYLKLLLERGFELTEEAHLWLKNKYEAHLWK